MVNLFGEREKWLKIAINVTKQMSRWRVQISVRDVLNVTEEEEEEKKTARTYFQVNPHHLAPVFVSRQMCLNISLIVLHSVHKTDWKFSLTCFIRLACHVMSCHFFCWIATKHTHFSIVCARDWAIERNSMQLTVRYELSNGHFIMWQVLLNKSII